MGPKTYVVFDSDLSDAEAAVLIAEKKGFELLQTDEKKNPAMYDPLYDENNLICIGGWHANAYSGYYFPQLEEGYDPITETLPDVPGVYADGRQVIATITRANGTDVTIIAGVSAEDTLRSAHDYVKPKVNVAIAIGLPALGVFITTVGYVWGKKTGRIK